MTPRLRVSAVSALVCLALLRSPGRAEDLREYGAVYDDDSPVAIAKDDVATPAKPAATPVARPDPVAARVDALEKQIAEQAARLAVLERPDPLDLGTYGAVYNDASPAAMEKNNAAIEKLLASWPMTGGELHVRGGALHISRPIRNPVRWQAVGAREFRPINFLISCSFTSTIVFHDPTGHAGSAIIFAPKTPTITYDGHFASGQDVRLAIRDVSLEGGGVEVIGGGKFTEVRNLRVARADVGLLLRHFDAGAIHDVVVRRCAVGARFESSMHLVLDNFRARECSLDGLQVGNCNGLTGNMNPESNERWQATFDDCQAANLHVWFEDTGRQKATRPLARLRHCQDIVLSGIDQAHWLDCDPVSRLTLRWLTDASSRAVMGEAVGALTDFAAYGGVPLFSQDGRTAICKPGCFDQPAMHEGKVVGELRGFDPQWERQYRAGDYVQVEADIVVDEATRRWCGDTQPLMITLAGGTFPDAKAVVRISGPTTHCELHGRAPADGKGLRVFAVLLNKRPQEQEVRFEFRNVIVRHLNN